MTARAALPLLATLGVAALLSACTPSFGPAQSYDGVPAANLPGDLCASVPADTVRAWKLVKTSHEKTSEVARTIATCAMTGWARGEAITVSMRVESRSGTDEEDAASTMERLSGLECGEIRQVGYSSAYDEGGGLAHDRHQEFEGGCVTVIPGERILLVGEAPDLHGIVRLEADYLDRDGTTSLDQAVLVRLADLGELLSGVDDMGADDTTGV